MMNGKERRLQPRVEVSWPVTLLTSEGAIQGETKDISMQGAFIYCDKPVALYERFVLSVKAPTTSMQVVAQVVWSNNSSSNKKMGRVGVGVRFIWS
jgi:tartrate dehydratase beta subunit/fumarate hydratase class I family protein